MTISPRSQWQLFAHSATCEVSGQFLGIPLAMNFHSFFHAIQGFSFLRSHAWSCKLWWKHYKIGAALMENSACFSKTLSRVSKSHATSWEVQPCHKGTLFQKRFHFWLSYIFQAVTGSIVFRCLHANCFGEAWRKRTLANPHRLVCTKNLRCHSPESPAKVPDIHHSVRLRCLLLNGWPFFECSQLWTRPP